MASDNDTDEQLALVTTTPAINLLLVTRKRCHGGEELPSIGESWRGQIGDISGYLCLTRLPMVSSELPWKVASMNTPNFFIRGIGGRQN
jgi:hypothetical protein